MTQFIDYYRVLGLQPEWDIDTIRKELRNKFAGTKARVNAAVGEKLEQINQLLKWITEAKKILTDPDAKAKYDQDLAQWKLTATPEQVVAAGAIPTLAEIWRLIDEGRYLDAIEGGKKLVQYTPDDDKAWEVYGYASYLWKDINTAIYASEQAINCNPRRADLYADAAQYYAAAEQWDQSELQLNRAINLEPNNPGYKLTLSQIYMQHKMWGEAQGVLKGVLSQEPQNQTARQFMAIVIAEKAETRFPEIDELLEQNKKREARKILKEVQKEFEEAGKLAENDPELQDLISSDSILVRRVLGVNFYRRVLEVIIDLALVLPAFLLMLVDNGNNPVATGFSIVLMIAIWGYSWVWLAYKNGGQDLTKRILGLQIASDSNTLPSLGQLIGRAIVKPISICLGLSFPFLVFLLSMFSVMGETNEAAVIGAIIGIIIGTVFGFFKLGFDLFFVTSKDYLPNFFGLVLFLHEHLTKTTVIASTRDDLMNFGEYHWY